MSKFILDKQTARLIVLQRIELLSMFQRKLRKFFGRYLFVNFFSKFIFNCNTVGSKYFDIMQQEFESVQKEIQFSRKKSFFSISTNIRYSVMLNQLGVIVAEKEWDPSRPPTDPWQEGRY